jgi:uncharacterized protein involved in exopolysaccharide biosynthesis
MGLIMLHNNLKEQKVIGIDQEDNTIKLRTANIATLYKSLLAATGNGFYEAREHLEILTTLGESLSTAMQEIEKRNQEAQKAHGELNDIESELSARREGIKVANTKKETKTKKDKK